MSDIIPVKVRRKLRDRKIRSLSKSGFSMDEICKVMSELGMGVSKTTVFFAVNGRSKEEERVRWQKRARNKKLKS